MSPCLDPGTVSPLEISRHTRLLTRLCVLALTMPLLAMACQDGEGPATRERALPDPELVRQLEPLVRRAMTPGWTPGLQVAVVMADGRKWVQGFGVADVRTGRRITTDTRFYIASTTKALTGLAAARLDNRGVIDLDAPIGVALPQAHFPPGYDASSVTVRDFLTHTHGLAQSPSSFRIAFTGQYTNELIFQLLERHDTLPNRDFRYANISYDVIGLLMDPEVTRGWKPVVEREVLVPLGMERTTAYRTRVPDSLIAWPHEDRPGGTRRIRLKKTDENLGPAGGHFSTAGDLARLLEAELNAGRVDGKQVIPAEVIAETQRAQVPQQRQFIFYDRHAWGLGWDIGTYDGDTVIHRPGGFAGYYSNVAFLPDHGFGVAVLTNGGRVGARVAEIVATAIYDELRGRSDVLERMDGRLADLAERVRESRARQEADLPEYAERPARPDSAYLGTFVSESWGEAEIYPGPEGLMIRSGAAVGDLRPLSASPDTFWTDLFGSDEVYFTVDRGRTVALRFEGIEEEYRRAE
ncbi:MAG: serine hydrolase [Gemmatimonadales bacterium]